MKGVYLMARFQAFCVFSLAVILSGTHPALGQPSSTVPPPQDGAPQAIYGPYQYIVINPRPAAGDSKDFRLFGHSFRELLNAAISSGTAVEPTWPERFNPVVKMTWSIHSLSELGQDAEHGKWLAETITQVVQPQSWNVVNGQKPTITFHPQGKALIVYNTPEVQAEVTAFLTNLKQTTKADWSVPMQLSKLPPPDRLWNPAPLIRNGQAVVDNARTGEMIRQLNEEQELRKAVDQEVMALKKQLRERESQMPTNSIETKDSYGHWQAELAELRVRMRKLEEYLEKHPSMANLPSSAKTIIPASYNLGLSAETVATAGTKGWVVPYSGHRPVYAPGQGMAAPDYLHGHSGPAHPANPYGGYPVPSVPQPKHLFHFIIRYEGEGIIDSNVVDMLKINAGKRDRDAPEKDAAEKNEKEEGKKTAEIEYPPFPKTPEKEHLKVKWRSDYNAARQEAKDRKLPICIIFCKDDCPMCVKMAETTFQDALIVGVLNDKFVPLKISSDSELANALNIESYPSFVFAASDGKIMHRHTAGYKDATAFFDELLKALDQRHLPDLPVQNALPAQPLAPPPSATNTQPLPPPLPPQSLDELR
jgi:hypothetical protein